MLSCKFLPFAAIVGQEQAKKALLIALVNSKAGGLLIGGKKGTAKTTLVRSSKELIAPQSMVEVPLNVTEDMLFGSIDIEYAVSKGKRRFLPGILGRADGNILYIDEANLLRQELLMAILDANIAGLNHVERDGISYSQPVHYTVIGTMNPQEGTLPSHLLDRFGMYVDVDNIESVEERTELIKRVLRYERSKGEFAKEYAQSNKELAEQIVAAKALLGQVEISEAMMQLAAQMCAQAFCAGHRAEIYLLEAARALAALSQRTYILPKDMQEAAVFVLPHRMRKPPEAEPEEANNSPEQNEDQEQSKDSKDDNQQEDNQSNDQEQQLPPPALDNTDDNSSDDAGDDTENQEQQDNSSSQLAPDEQIAEIDKSFRLPKLVLDLGKNNTVRRGSGKRSATRTDLKQGRYVRAELPKNKVEDLAFDATIRAAAPYQRIREDNGCALNIQKEDLRQKVREKRIGNTFLFAVDASGSMGARKRMNAVKGAIFYMLQDAYQKRDRVGMLAFRRDKAEVLLPITRSVDLAQKCLAEMSTGGKTPLADGLATALLTLSRLNKRDKELEPILVLVTDGRANAVMEGETDPVGSALKIAEKIRKAQITSVVIDTENDFINLGIAKKLAQTMGAAYYSLGQLSKEQILRIVRNLGE